MSALFISEAERRLIPSSGVRGPVPVLIAIMTFVMVVVGAAGLALSNTASVVKSGVENRYSIQIADGGSKAPAASAAARAQPGVVRVAQVPPEDLRRTLERWLGPAGEEADLPLPAIIDVDLQPGTDPGAVGNAVENAEVALLAARDLLPAGVQPEGARRGVLDPIGRAVGQLAGYREELEPGLPERRSRMVRFDDDLTAEAVGFGHDADEQQVHIPP